MRTAARDEQDVTAEARKQLIRRAHVWRPPATRIPHAALGGAANLTTLECAFKVTDVGGTTAKFDCVGDDGHQIRVKYGSGPEIPAEVATTRLLRALGFGADEVTLVERLRCFGCPAEPFAVLKAVELTATEELMKRTVDRDDFRDFAWVAVERKFDARPIETDGRKGWGFYELAAIDERAGGAPRAHVDALRLLAVLLAHWDNKPQNQRLVCLTREWTGEGRCPAPFLLLQDVGATFGPRKVDLEAWREAPIWADSGTCLVSMRDFPHGGATFEEVRVSEAGRRFLAELLGQLTPQQLHDLFAGARFDRARGWFATVHPISAWVDVFASKIRAIRERPACPRVEDAAPVA